MLNIYTNYKLDKNILTLPAIFMQLIKLPLFPLDRNQVHFSIFNCNYCSNLLFLVLNKQKCYRYKRYGNCFAFLFKLLEVEQFYYPCKRTFTEEYFLSPNTFLLKKCGVTNDQYVMWGVNDKWRDMPINQLCMTYLLMIGESKSKHTFAVR